MYIPKMVSAIFSSASALQSVSTRSAISAHDTANLNTPGFSQSRPIQAATSDGTEIAAIQRIAPPSEQESATEPAEEAVEQMTNRATLQANAQTLRIQDQMLGTLLDIQT